MRKALIVILHILGYPVLLGLMLWFNWDILMSQTKNYGIFVFVGIIVTAVMAIVYYIVYGIVTRKRKKNKKSIFNQTRKIALAVVISLCGLWIICDVALPNFLADKTSNTVYYEDLADNWQDRAEVNENLLNDFIALSVKAGTLPYDSESMTEEEAIEYYQGLSINQQVDELSNEKYGTIAELFAIQFQSIDAAGYTAFHKPWIDFATSDRLTIPCIVHLLLDNKELTQENVTKSEYAEYDEATGKYTSVWFATYDNTSKKIVIEVDGVTWTVLDMLGENTDIALDLSTMVPTEFQGIIKTLGPNLVKTVLNPLLEQLTGVLADKDILNAKINVVASLDGLNANISLVPMNEKRGVLGYQQMAWLNSNGLLYAIVTLFSCRQIFLIFAAWEVLITFLIGLARGMGKEEKERRLKLQNPPIRSVESSDEYDIVYDKMN